MMRARGGSRYPPKMMTSFMNSPLASDFCSRLGTDSYPYSRTSSYDIANTFDVASTIDVASSYDIASTYEVASTYDIASTLLQSKRFLSEKARSHCYISTSNQNSIGFCGITFHIYLLCRANCIIKIVTLITIFISLHYDVL